MARVVGTIVEAAFLKEAAAGAPLPCDLVEVRLDRCLPCPDWLPLAQQIERRGKPVLLTLRSHLEGGVFAEPDGARLPYMTKAIEGLSAVDVELNSSIAAQVARLAQQQGKPCVLSFHDFEKTPSEAELAGLIGRAEELGGVVKISAMARDAQDVARLRGLLDRPRARPLCVIAMGPLATGTRVAFAAAGSCLTYGYLDSPGAPGQLSAAELVARLTEASDAYRQDRAARPS